MQSFYQTIVWRHRRENLKKCSLRGLEQRPDFHFYSYPTTLLPNLENYIVLSLDAEPLSVEDAGCGLLILDATWRYAEKMLQHVQKMPGILYRSIPASYKTAYPRRQEDCADPERGLASVEAIYIAYHILGRDITGLLDRYHWKDEFLQKNSL